MLRLASPVAPRQRLEEVLRQLSGIGGGRSLGFGPNRVRSLPDGVSQALANYLDTTKNVDMAEVGANGKQNVSNVPEGQAENIPDLGVFTKGDLCPECGQAAVINEEGCRKCYSCAYSEC